MARKSSDAPRSSFRTFFVRGLAILLPTVLTIWILAAVYMFVQDRIAGPINEGVRELFVRFSYYPVVTEDDMEAHAATLDPSKLKKWRDADNYEALLRRDARRMLLRSRWNAYRFPLDLIGLIIAIALIYMFGAVFGSFLGRSLYARGEQFINKLPLVRNVYPSIKQVTDFLFGDEDKKKATFSKVVAVEYPRKGLWSLGLVTGATMKSIQSKAGEECVTVFVPSSPTPFTGYVITVPQKDTIPVQVSIEEALRFAVSGGVVVPDAELIGGKPDEVQQRYMASRSGD